MAGWPELRAGLIALAIGIGLVDGCPLPNPDKTPAWQRGFVEPVRRVQAVVLTPVAWVRPTLRIAQKWSLYQAPSAQRFRLWIEGQDAAGQWHLVFRASDPDHDEDRELIDYTRPRGTWDPTSKPPGQYPLFANWMTHRVLERHPEFVAARIQLEQVELSPGGIVYTGRFVHPYARQRPTWFPPIRTERGAP
jgi:hypothetical protein